MTDPGAWGVATGYSAYDGSWRDSPPETVDAVLEAMGASGRTPPGAEPMTVRTDRPMPDLGSGQLLLEDGEKVDVSGALPPDVPHGYHTFVPASGQGRLLVCSPGRVPDPSGRMWGFAAQLYAVRSERSWGVGDLADLEELGRWASGLGAGFTLVNPLHAATPSVPQQPSPYYPGSRCFMNPLYIAVDRVPGAARGDLRHEAMVLNSERLIDRDRVWAIKSEALRPAFEAGSRSSGFERYRKERGDALEKFAAFCALSEEHGTTWREWPAELRHPDSPAVRTFAGGEGEGRMRWHSWLQWVLDSQAAEAASGLDLVVDLAVGVDPSGPDSWIWQDCFAEGMRVGAPPDEFNTLGQDWGLPPFDPWRLRSGGYAPWREALRSNLAHAAGLRVDHVMGLFRLYWIPEGSDARSGAYVSYRSDEMLDILALEAERAGAYVVGEDLGTVEDRVREDLADRHVMSYRVWWFEDAAPEEWPARAMGALTTHDLPTVAGVLTGSDLEAQRRIGTEPNEESSQALQDKLLERTGAEVGDDPAGVVAAAYGDLSSAPCSLLTVSLDDVLTVEERPNMPGTTDQWPNWCIALPATLEKIETVPLAARIAEAMKGRS